MSPIHFLPDSDEQRLPIEARATVWDRAAPRGLLLATIVWLAAFSARLPEVNVESRWLLAVLLTVMAVGAITIGWRAGSVAVSTASLLVAGLVNCLLIASVVHSRAAASPEVVRVTLSDWAWIPGSLVTATAIGSLFGAAGRFIGATRRAAAPARRPSTQRLQAALGAVIVLTTLCLMTVGSLVTSMEVGLSVPDWPTSYGYNMFFFPFTKMVGGIYYEHAHRLIGTLVGLQTIVLCAWLWLKPPRIGAGIALESGHCPHCSYSIMGLVGRRCPECGGTWSQRDEQPGRAARLLARWPLFVQRNPLAMLGTAVLVLVIVQGVLGGRRVTLVNTSGHDVAELLAVVHACLAQLFLLAAALLMFALHRSAQTAVREACAAKGSRPAVCSSPQMRKAAARVGLALVLLALGQTILGAITRHYGLDWALLLHVLGAVAVVLATLTFASIIMMHSPARRLRLGAGVLIAGVALQVFLGAVSWWITTRLDRLDQILDLGVSSLVSAHVVVGAIFLLAAWLMTLAVAASRAGAALADAGRVESAAPLIAPAAQRGVA